MAVRISLSPPITGSDRCFSRKKRWSDHVGRFFLRACDDVDVAADFDGRLGVTSFARLARVSIFKR